MTTTRLLRSEIRKLTTTKMPWIFLGILAALAAVNAFAVVAGTDFDGSKGFVSTELDQMSMVAFAGNAFAIAGLFGTVAAAREFSHRTAVATFLTTPRRLRASAWQTGAVALAGAALGLAGAGLTVGSVALALPSTEYGFMISTAHLTRILAASMVAGATGAVFGAGVGALIRNVGGAVIGTVLALFIAPPLVVQFLAGAESWTPTVLSWVLSGVADAVSPLAAAAALAAWALIPAFAGAYAVTRRDVV